MGAWDMSCSPLEGEVLAVNFILGSAASRWLEKGVTQQVGSFPDGIPAFTANALFRLAWFLRLPADAVLIWTAHEPETPPLIGAWRLVLGISPRGLFKEVADSGNQGPFTIVPLDFSRAPSNVRKFLQELRERTHFQHLGDVVHLAWQVEIRYSLAKAGGELSLFHEGVFKKICFPY